MDDGVGEEGIPESYHGERVVECVVPWQSRARASSDNDNDSNNKNNSEHSNEHKTIGHHKHEKRLGFELVALFDYEP